MLVTVALTVVTLQSFVAAQWQSTLMGSGATDLVRAVAVDKNGDFFVSYSFLSNSVTLTDVSGQVVQTVQSIGGWDTFLAKFASNGTFLWRAVQGGTSYEAATESLATDSTGSVYTAITSTSASIVVNDAQGNQAASYSLQGTYSIVLSKYLTNGSVSWSVRMGNIEGSAIGWIQEFAVGKSDVLCISGYAASGFVFFSTNGQAAATLQTGNGTDDGFTALYSPNGTFLWAISVSSQGSDRVNSAAFDSLENLYITGQLGFNTSTSISTLNGQPIRTFTTRPNGAFLIKFAFNGTLMWLATQDGPQSVHGYAVAVDIYDNVLILGLYRLGPVSFTDGNGTVRYNLRSITTINPYTGLLTHQAAMLLLFRVLMVVLQYCYRIL